MTKNELMGLLNINLMSCVRQRDKVNVELFPAEHGYYNGQYRAYETVIGMLAMLDIETLAACDNRNFGCI